MGWYSKQRDFFHTTVQKQEHNKTNLHLRHNIPRSSYISFANQTSFRVSERGTDDGFSFWMNRFLKKIDWVNDLRFSRSWLNRTNLLRKWFNDSLVKTVFVLEWISFRMNRLNEWLNDSLIKTVTCRHLQLTKDSAPLKHRLTVCL